MSHDIYLALEDPSPEQLGLSCDQIVSMPRHVVDAVFIEYYRMAGVPYRISIDAAAQEKIVRYVDRVVDACTIAALKHQLAACQQQLRQASVQHVTPSVASRLHVKPAGQASSTLGSRLAALASDPTVRIVSVVSLAMLGGLAVVWHQSRD